ncbi:MAG: hypothetical protein J7599_07485 [Niabella sp.]|nr:hypothetical protein [Niabella sp.]
MGDLTKTFAGKAIVLMVSDPAITNDPFKIVMCQTSASTSSQKNTNVTQTKCGPKTSASDPTETVSVEGLLMRAKDSGDTTSVDMFDFWAIFKANKNYNWKLAPEDASAASNGLPVYSWTGEVTQSDDTLPAEGDATFSAQISVVGELDKDPYTYVP